MTVHTKSESSPLTKVADHPVLAPLIDVCSDLYRAGWAENHAGNVSIRLNDEELDAFDLTTAPPTRFVDPMPALAGESFLVTAAGSAFRLLVKQALQL